MDSRISIKGDFQRNTPFIEVHYKQSDDVRDDMVKAFTEKFAHSSQWVRVEWQVQDGVFRLYPIPPENLESDIERMKNSLELYKKWAADTGITGA